MHARRRGAGLVALGNEAAVFICTCAQVQGCSCEVLETWRFKVFAMSALLCFPSGLAVGFIFLLPAYII